MSNLLEWKEKLQKFYAIYSAYIDRLLQFVLALASFMLINNHIGFMQKLTSPLISVVLAFVCAFLPAIVTVFVASGLMLVHMFSLSVGVAVIAAVILFVMFVFYFRMTPKKAVILLLTPIAFAFKVPALIPVAYGLIGSPIYMVPVICGTIVYFLISYAKTFSSTLGGTEKAGLMDVVTRFSKQIFQSKEMWLVIAAMVVCLLLVYLIRRRSVNHAWEAAIIAGTVVYVLVMVAGDLLLDVSVNYVTLIAGGVGAVLLGLVLEVMVFSVDYARTEYLQFEDDEYYYYVKAVPKASVAVPEKTVKRINVRQEPETADKKKDEIDRLIEQELMK